ncbi:major facilitator superfamily, putative [Trypanosoma equiperdum]|uniref:Major facilitator superfamily, putative n=1 Tax=Trypanosoma equiperdum TaxID=5694 RepID=A0A1G4I6Z0_TRYEQ|nr:major facilitator superfamily, putative [Trypanosoma equiperdum]
MACSLRQCLLSYGVAESAMLREQVEEDVTTPVSEHEEEEEAAPTTHLLSPRGTVRLIDGYESTGHRDTHCLSPDSRERGSWIYHRPPIYGLQALSEPKRFWQLVVGALCCFVVSSSFTFNLYSGQLQAKFNFTQNDITSIFTGSDVAGILMLPLGAVYDKYGARPVFILALLTQPVGAILQALTYDDFIKGNLYLFIFYSALQAVGTWLLDTAAVMTLLSIFPSDKGPVVALSKVITGIGYGVIGAIHSAFFYGGEAKDTRNFFIFLASIGVVATVLGYMYLEDPPYVVKGSEVDTITRKERVTRRRLRRIYLRQRPSGLRFAIGFGIVAVLMVYLPVQAIVSMYFNLGHRYRVSFACTTVAILALYPVMALPLQCLERSQSLILPMTSTRCSERSSCVSRAASESVGSVACVDDLDYMAPQFHIKLADNIKTLRFWALMWTMFSLSGAEVLVLANMRFLLAAFDGGLLADTYVGYLLVLTSVGSGFGRIILSLFEMVSQNRSAEERIPITGALFVPAVVQVVALSLFFVLPAPLLAIPCFLVSFAGGCSAAASVIVVRTIFASDVGKYYNCITVATVVSSLLINRGLYGEVYTHEAMKEGKTICLGRQCVILPIIVVLVACVSSLLAVGYIHRDYSQHCEHMFELHKQRHASNEAPVKADHIGFNFKRSGKQSPAGGSAANI